MKRDLTAEEETAVLATHRFKAEDVQIDVTACLALLHQATEELEDLASSAEDAITDAMLPEAASARGAAAALTTLACSLSTIAIRMVRQAGKLEGLCDAAERAEKAERMVEAFEDGSMGDLAPPTIAREISRREEQAEGSVTP